MFGILKSLHYIREKEIESWGWGRVYRVNEGEVERSDELVFSLTSRHRGWRPRTLCTPPSLSPGRWSEACADELCQQL